jgi:uncharacterized protein
MNHSPFDPFRDRLSRDIRNDLSESLLACLREHRLDPAREVAERFFAAAPGPEQMAYIIDRLERYARFLVRVAEEPAADVVWQGLVLWDLGLHFEVHEILEHAWLRTQGDGKSLSPGPDPGRRSVYQERVWFPRGRGQNGGQGPAGAGGQSGSTRRLYRP